MEVNTEGALRSLVLQLLHSEGNAQDGCQTSADPVSWVGGPSDAHHGRETDEWLDCSFNPVHSYVVDAVFGEVGKDGGVGVAAGGDLSPP